MVQNIKPLHSYIFLIWNNTIDISCSDITIMITAHKHITTLLTIEVQQSVIILWPYIRKSIIPSSIHTIPKPVTQQNTNVSSLNPNTLYRII